MSRKHGSMTDDKSPPVTDGSGPPPPRPVWVKASLAFAALVAVALVVILATGGEHGPRRHFGSPALGGAATSAAAMPATGW